MKFIYIIAVLLSTYANAQSRTDSLKYKINEVLRLKHAYEATLKLAELNERKTSLQPVYNQVKGSYIIAGGKKNKVLAFSAYLNAISFIKKNGSIYRPFFEEILKSKDTSILSRRFVNYNYEDPLSSVRDKNNTITELAYYNVINHFILELDRNILPELNEAGKFIVRPNDFSGIAGTSKL